VEEPNAEAVMKFHAFCLIFVLSASPALQAQSSLSKESDEELDKQLKALDKQAAELQKQIKALQDQVDELGNKQALVRSEQNRRAAKLWEAERKTHFAKMEIRGKLKKSKTFKTVDKNVR
jgi:peptidoglycan hydrolase CwlO-like protein